MSQQISGGNLCRRNDELTHIELVKAGGRLDRPRRLLYYAFAPNPSVYAMLSCRLEAARVEGGGDHVPKAIALIAGSSLGPEAIDAVRKAFDNAWAEVAGNFNDVAQKESARITLGRSDFVSCHE